MAKKKPPKTPPTAVANALARSNGLLMQALEEIEELRAENRSLRTALALAEDAAIGRMGNLEYAEFDTREEIDT